MYNMCVRYEVHNSSQCRRGGSTTASGNHGRWWISQVVQTKIPTSVLSTIMYLKRRRKGRQDRRKSLSLTQTVLFCSAFRDCNLFPTQEEENSREKKEREREYTTAHQRFDSMMVNCLHTYVKPPPSISFSIHHHHHHLHLPSSNRSILFS